MDAIEFLKKKKRMCESFETCVNSYSGGCPLSHLRSIYTEKCEDSISNHPNKAVAIVEKWSEEHPKKTMLQDLLEKHPNTILKNDGTPIFTCPYYLGYEERVTYCDGSKCFECWNRPLEED